MQQFDCTYEKTFMSYTISSVAGDTVSVHARSTIISLSFMLPHVMTVLSFPVLKKVRHAALPRAATALTVMCPVSAVRGPHGCFVYTLGARRPHVRCVAHRQRHPLAGVCLYPSEPSRVGGVVPLVSDGAQ